MKRLTQAVALVLLATISVRADEAKSKDEKPVVVPFGSTSPELTGPISSPGTRHQLIKFDAPCSPCFLRECPIDFRCMNGITVERVVEAVVRAAGGK